MALTHRDIGGIITATVTPFTADGQLDAAELRSHVEFLIKRGTSGLAPLGGTGEYPALSFREREQVVGLTVEAASGRVPVIAGVLATGYEDALQSGLAAKSAGASALMVVTPYYTLAEDAGIRRYFDRYRRAVDLPIVLYEIPRRTNMELQAETIANMVTDGSVIGMKYSGYDFNKFTRIVQRAGDAMAVLSGEEPLFPAQVALGAKGGVLAISNIDPAPWQRILSLVQAGQMREALGIHAQFGPLIDAVYSEMNPVGLKAALQLRGTGNGSVRLPLEEAKHVTHSRLAQALALLEAQ
ncbi:4-hydroxy-tetrahydrodipicolinate synthase [Mesorhizobium loti]|nr:4-hydroxy-tetrahydrodipicolinate synthase [Mesorhizobium loti]PLP56678.1 4-hydroxy-tetrahydrodipicolinate synthase [Mesorhizobium loti]